MYNIWVKERQWEWLVIFRRKDADPNIIYQRGGPNIYVRVQKDTYRILNENDPRSN